MNVSFSEFNKINHLGNFMIWLGLAGAEFPLYVTSEPVLPLWTLH